ncbi:MAG TPA: DUF2089 family protein [Kiloniellales bacterium]
MHHCGNCGSALEVGRLTCPACRLVYDGSFHLPRLARLEAGHQHLAEQILLAAGNLKEVAGVLEVSYPTLRKRIDALIQALEALRGQDDALGRRYLEAVEGGAMAPEEAARRIRELNGGA